MSYTRDSITRFIENELHLKVNRDKTHVGYVRSMKFLGYSFYVTKDECRMSVHPKGIQKMKAQLRELTLRSKRYVYEVQKQKLSIFIRGRIEYFKLADMKNL